MTSDSRVRIDRVAPEKWTIDDVGVWLAKEDMGHLRGTFRRNKISGQQLLSLDPHRLMREMAINDDGEVKRILEAVRLLKHIAFQSHNWNTANTGACTITCMHMLRSHDFLLIVCRS